MNKHSVVARIADEIIRSWLVNKAQLQVQPTVDQFVGN